MQPAPMMGGFGGMQGGYGGMQGGYVGMQGGPGMMHEQRPMFQGGPGTMHQGGMMYQGGPGMMHQGGPGGPGMFAGNPGMQQRGPGGQGQGMTNPSMIPNSGRFAPTTVSSQTDQQGTYAQTQECWGNCCGFISTYICPCCCNPPYQTVPQGHAGIIQRFGKFYRLVAPGMHYLNPDLDTLVLVDRRERVHNLHRQKVVTRDNITTTIDAVLYFKVVDSYKSKFAVTNLEAAMVDLVQTTLRNVIGRMSLQDMLEKREELSEKIMEYVTAPAFDWGAKVMRVLIQDIFLPDDQKANMSQGAISKKIAEAKVIQSQADVEAARLMREAAQILSTDAAMQIRYVESLEILSRTGNPKMVFFPADYREIGSMNEHILG